MPVLLQARRQGPAAPNGRRPLHILHGLLGSSRNWAGVARTLAAERTVWTYDLRNHGSSPWAEPHDYPALAEDVALALDARAAEGEAPGVLLGHSMGGKTALRLALTAPERIAGLVVVDIAPRRYPPGRHDNLLDAMIDLPLAGLARREDAFRALAATVPDEPTRHFLLTNLDRDPAGGWRWLPNLALLRHHLRDLEDAGIPSQGRYDGPALVVSGGRSNYVVPADQDHFAALLPDLQWSILPDSGHSPHVETPAAFLAVLQDFLRRPDR